MTLTEKKNILLRLGSILHAIAEDKDWPGYEIGINEEEYNSLKELTNQVHIYNGWFKPQEVKRSFLGISKWLTDSSLNTWLSKYDLEKVRPKTVAIIMAGNIPLVGFHDLLSVFISGHRAIVKMSSEDDKLLPAILNILSLFSEDVSSEIELVQGKMEGFDAVIATGSDNSSKYFESYFGKYPHIIRKNRNSLAIIKGSETAEELVALGNDIFDYYGLGCRNVSQIWIPENYDLNVFFDAIYSHKDIINHNKYANNYDYNKAVKLLNEEQLLDNGFILLKEDGSLSSPLAVIHYQRYQSSSDYENFLEIHEDQIQVVVGKDYIPFGATQQPELWDYADGVDTLKFLSGL